MEENLISIIIPVYNAEKYLDYCITSILKQTYRTFELILINDGSTDKSEEICLRYQQKDNRICLISKTNEGVSSARNAGLCNSTGEYITFVDADDYLEHNYLVVLYYNLKKQNADISICNFNCLYENKKLQEANKLKSTSVFLDQNMNYYRFSSLFCYVCGKLFKRNTLENIYFNTKIFISEDSLFIAEAVKKSSVLFYDERPLYIYRMHSASATHSFDIAKIETLEIAWKKILDLQEPDSSAYWWASFCYMESCRRVAAELWISRNRNPEKIHSLRNEVRKRQTLIRSADAKPARKVMLYLFLHMPLIYFCLCNTKKWIQTKLNILKP
ncbi:MAG: glycosyltransferase [Eubacterium sp.]|jgi:glycosyltransferase involved in cell wall biosynthesis|nr:glycosyltransferase [Eubacterium sp.]